MKHKIRVFFSNKDYFYNFENYGKTYNLLFVTGLVGSGKTTISQKISNEKKAIVLSQDWLAWSEVYKENDFAVNILKEFYTICPEAKNAVDNNSWHKGLLTSKEKSYIRKKYNEFLINYSKKYPNNLYIIEGIDIYKTIDLKEITKRGIIVKRTSVLKCFIRRYKRDKTFENQKNFKNKVNYLIMIIKQSKIYYFRDRKKLNNIIKEINKKEKNYLVFK